MYKYKNSVLVFLNQGQGIKDNTRAIFEVFKANKNLTSYQG